MKKKEGWILSRVTVVELLVILAMLIWGIHRMGFVAGQKDFVGRLEANGIVLCQQTLAR